MDKPRIAIFDFDGTLIRHDSMFAFASFAIGSWRMIRGVICVIPALLQWKIGRNTAANAKEALLTRWYRGLDYDTLTDKAGNFATVLDRLIRPNIMEQMNTLLAQGCRVYIVSASIGLWIRPWAKKHGITNVIATEMEVDADNRFTGRLSTPNCKGVEKVHRFLSAEPNRQGYHLIVFGNRPQDIPLLSIADTQHIVK